MTDPMPDPKSTTLSGKVRSVVSMTPAQLQDKGLPPERAEEKSSNTSAGWLAALLGFALVAGAGWVSLIIAQGPREISLMVVLLISVLGGIGCLFFGVGMSLVSRDASPIIAGMGEVLIKFIKAIRGGSSA